MQCELRAGKGDDIATGEQVEQKYKRKKTHLSDKSSGK